MKKLLIFVLIFLSTFGCKAEVQKELKHSFGIYLIKEGKFTEVGKDPYYLKSIKVDLHKAELLKKPIISDKDIVEYDWENHTLTVNAEAVARIPQPSSFGIPFVVVADGNRCYVGGFWTMVSSVGCLHPIIEVNDAKDGTFRIRAGYPRDVNLLKENDPRFDERIKKSLKGLGKLKANKK
ncbi:MAG: hypothetical protein WC947_05020 [Elusimicrobiota bacterium]